MSALSEKIKQSRQTKVETGGFTFVVNRPTDLEMSEMRGQKTTQRLVLEKFVVGWEGVKEMDLYSGGTGELVPFDREAYLEFIADNPQLWAPITSAVIDGYKQHELQLAESLKTSGLA
jgi:hypothetical protein